VQPKFRAAIVVICLTLLILVGGEIVSSPSARLRVVAALRAFRAGIRQETDARPQSQVWFERGQEARSQGDLQAAAAAWQISLRYGAPPLQIYPRLVEAHRRLGDLESLSDDLSVLVSYTPTNPAWQYELGLILIVLQPKEARQHLAIAAELEPDIAQEVHLLERGLSSTLISSDPAFQMVASGRALASIGEWELANAAFAQATRLNPGYAEAWAFLGEARRQTGKNGLPELHRAVKLDSQSVAANTLLSIYWQQTGRLDLALVYLEAAARQDMNNPVLQAALGRVLAQQGNLQDALRHYQRAAEANPRDPATWRALANFTIEFGTRVKEVGLPAARTAVLLNPKDPASLDTMAQVYILLGNPLIAQRFLNRALAANPGYAPARLHLGLVSLLHGNNSIAREQLQLARNLAPDGSAVEEQTRRLLLNVQP
jgi:tetratricopeptide (TPR) repeat protein